MKQIKNQRIALIVVRIALPRLDMDYIDLLQNPIKKLKRVDGFREDVYRILLCLNGYVRPVILEYLNHIKRRKLIRFDETSSNY